MAVIKYIDPETKQPVKIPISGGGGTSVEPNPELSGDEESLNSIKIAGTSYKVEGGEQVQSDWAEEDETAPAFIQNKPLDLVHISNDSSTIQADIIGGNGMHNYSTEEHIVGSWIDKKPIYEKVIELNNYSYSTSGTDIDLGELNSKIKILINSFFCSWDPDTKLTQFISIPMWYNIEKKVFRYKATEGLGNHENQTIYLIIQYTKTTD